MLQSSVNPFIKPISLIPQFCNPRLHSLEALAYVPNLKSLVIDLGAWDNSAAADLTPIAGLFSLEKLCPHTIHNPETPRLLSDGPVSVLQCFPLFLPGPPHPDSDHIAMEEKIRTEFFAKIEETINQYGGTLTIYDTIDMQLARKP